MTIKGGKEENLTKLGFICTHCLGKLYKHMVLGRVTNAEHTCKWCGAVGRMVIVSSIKSKKVAELNT
jgi:hypothetical protein